MRREGRTLLVIAVSIALGATVAMAQAQSPVPALASAKAEAYVPTMTFDVASVREAKVNFATGFTMSVGFVPANSSHARVQNLALMDLVMWAYGVNALRMDWPKDVPLELAQARFNVEAKGDAETDERLAKLSKAEIELEHQHMMQALLQDRFGLKARWETRDAKTYELVVVKGGRMRSTGAKPTKEEVATFGDRGVPSLYEKSLDGGGIEHIAHGASMT